MRKSERLAIELQQLQSKFEFEFECWEETRKKLEQETGRLGDEIVRRETANRTLGERDRDRDTKRQEETGDRSEETARQETGRHGHHPQALQSATSSNWEGVWTALEEASPQYQAQLKKLEGRYQLLTQQFEESLQLIGQLNEALEEEKEVATLYRDQLNNDLTKKIPP
eukprot:Platyproteum_vivax@DN12039_c0_g1_i1.p1